MITVWEFNDCYCLGVITTFQTHKCEVELINIVTRNSKVLNKLCGNSFLLVAPTGYDSPLCCEKRPVREANIASEFTSTHIHVFMLEFFSTDRYYFIPHLKETVPHKLQPPPLAAKPNFKSSSLPQRFV